MKKYRTIVYVDGFNLFHAIDELGRNDLKWLDLDALSQSVLRKNEKLVEVKYFSAYPTWIQEALNTHRRYTKALEQVGVTLVMGRFKNKYVKCQKCGRRYTTKEEKETDVNLAVHLVVDGMKDRYDRAIVITADTDMGAGVDMARHEQPTKEISVMAPPGRLSRARDLDPVMEIRANRLKQCLLEAEYKDDAGNVIVSRPEKYAPEQKQ